MSETFKIGTLVWAKMKGFPPWPGRVSNPPKDAKRQSVKKGQHCIYFFGSKNYGYIEEPQLKPYFEFKDTLKNANKSAGFKEAVAAIELFIENKGENFNDTASLNDSEEAFNRLKESSVPDSENEKSAKPDKPEKPKKPKKDVTAAKIKRENSKSGASPSVPRKKVKSSHLDDSTYSGLETSSILNHVGSPKKTPGSNLLDRPTNIIRPDTPPLDVENISQTLREKNVLPSDLKFGFLGLGIMGSGMVKNLLNSGHSVIVWNRTPDKCADFVKAGAEQGMTPSDVVQVADITFSCVADPQAAKDMVFGNCGVLPEMNPNKGYVEMTGIDAETSQDIADAILGKGGRYLEAQVQGSKVQAEEGTLVLLAAGDRQLFDECQSCFIAMSKNSFYLGEVGNASKMNLVLQMMAGVTIAGLAEGMALADRAGLQQKDVLEVMQLTALACPTILEKGKAIIDGGFSTHLPLQHLQKDLKLSLNLGDQLEQPLPLTASANEVFKHAKRLGYGEHDASAVYIRARF
nr:PREDICTED: putative oxidoreductase GLYR1 homolog [Bemisia tabaci]